MERQPGAIDHQVGQRIAAARQAAGLTLRDLADRLGWPHTTLSNYEVGRRPLTLGRLCEIATALERSPASFLVEPPEAAAIVDALAGNLDRCLQVQMVLDSLDDPLPDLDA